MADFEAGAPPDVIEALGRIEAQADDCWRGLAITTMSSDLGVWALLTGSISFVEREQAIRGSNTPHFDAMLSNVGRLLPSALRWVIEHGPLATEPLETRWSDALTAAVGQALGVARPYSHFETGFQAFHKGRYAAEVVTPTLVRFSVPGSQRDRQVSAYQKSHRPREGAYASVRPQPRQQSQRVELLFREALRGCRQTGSLSFECGDLWVLWRELFPEYHERAQGLTRRAGSLSLGSYTLNEFNAFYAALMAICATHDFLCFMWGRDHPYPLESAILVRDRVGWLDPLSGLSGLPYEHCAQMLLDLTFVPGQTVDLHIQPFVVLDASKDVIALAPPFPLHGRHDENILRVCSQRRPRVYDVTSREKEGEMLGTLRETVARYSPRGPVSLPAPVPDIDLLLVDEGLSVIVIAELKWIRKPVRPAEIPDRDADVLKGIEQLGRIRAYISNNPDHLATLGALARPIGDYEHIYYVLVARDHWRWVEPSPAMAIIEFDAFVAGLKTGKDLQTAMQELLRYDWLPIEGRDFFVRFERATVNGVSLESEVFYSTAPA